MAARTNYLMAIRDLLRHAASVELPVYLCDSIMTPSEYGDLFTNRLGNVQQLKTSAGDFNIPTEVVHSRESIGHYADTLEFCIRNRYAAEDFLERCAAEDIPTNEPHLHKELYRHLQQLDADNKNGVWARIIKNAFAPLFVGRVDYVAGNPPWVNWFNLPEEYRMTTASLWQQYDLFRQRGYKAKLGGACDDVSVLMTYVAHDRYLKDGGKLGFVITQSVFKTVGGGEGFRSFTYEVDGDQWVVQPLRVHDLSAFQPFEGATNRTSIFLCTKGRMGFIYPVPYIVWKKSVRGRIDQDLSLGEVQARTTRTELAAEPIQTTDSTSPWLTAPTEALPGVKKVLGPSAYTANLGCHTWLNGVYWIRVLDERPNGELLVENLHNVGKIKVQHLQTVIEPDLIYPLLRGRDVQRWRAEPSAHIILANRTDKLAGISVAEMKRRWPKTFAYFRQFEGDAQKPVRGSLRGRSGYKRYFKPSDPFYSMYNIGPYTLAEWKVVWREQSAMFQAALAGAQTGKPIVPDHKLMMVSCSSELEADYLLGILNSSPSILAIHSYVISTSTSTHVLSNVAVPYFDASDGVHVRLSELARKCRVAASRDDGAQITQLEREIDKVAARLWGIMPAELRAIQSALASM